MKPECSEYRQKIARSLLGDLTSDERQAFDAHLAGCPQCQSEKESYARTLDIMHSVGNEPVPCHFFVQPEKRALNPWELFRMLKPGWQAVTAAVAGFFLLAGLGGILGFTRNQVDVAALKKDFLTAAEEQDRRTAESFLQEVRTEIARSGADITRQRRTELAAAVDRIDSQMDTQLKQTENRAHEDAQEIAVDLYRTVTQQRAQDLNLINLRFDGIETKNTIDMHKTDTILGTLLQVADLKLE